ERRLFARANRERKAARVDERPARIVAQAGGRQVQREARLFRERTGHGDLLDEVRHMAAFLLQARGPALAARSFENQLCGVGRVYWRAEVHAHRLERDALGTRVDFLAVETGREIGAG